MKTTDSKITFSCNFAVAAALSLLSLSTLAESSFQMNVLFNPGSSLLVAEAGGRVMIYDGLKSETVDKALDEQFERIENMMFVRTQYQQEDGEYAALTDDCD